MTTGLPLHMRRLPSGRFVATLVPFTDLSFDGDALTEVREAARRAAVARLDELPGVLRADVIDQGTAELESVRVRVAGEPGTERVAITDRRLLGVPAQKPQSEMRTAALRSGSLSAS